MTAINHSLIEKALACLRNGDPGQCGAMLREHLKTLAEMPAPELSALAPESAHSIAVAFDALGRASFALQNPQAGRDALRQGTAFLTSYLAQAGLDATAAQPLQTTLIGLWQNAAFAALEQQDFAASEAACAQALDLAASILQPDSPRLASVYFSISALPYRLRQWDRAEELTRKAMHIWQNLPEPNQEKTAACMNNLGRICEERGDMDTGIAWHRKAVALRRPLPNREDLAFSLGNLGVALAQNSQWKEACASLEEAVLTYENAGMGDSRACRGYAANLEICRKALNDRCA